MSERAWLDRQQRDTIEVDWDLPPDVDQDHPYHDAPYEQHCAQGSTGFLWVVCFLLAIVSANKVLSYSQVTTPVFTGNCECAGEPVAYGSSECTVEFSQIIEINGNTVNTKRGRAVCSDSAISLIKGTMASGGATIVESPQPSTDVPSTDAPITGNCKCTGIPVYSSEDPCSIDIKRVTGTEGTLVHTVMGDASCDTKTVEMIKKLAANAATKARSPRRKREITTAKTHTYSPPPPSPPEPTHNSVPLASPVQQDSHPDDPHFDASPPNTPTPPSALQLDEGDSRLMSRPNLTIADFFPPNVTQPEGDEFFLIKRLGLNLGDLLSFIPSQNRPPRLGYIPKAPPGSTYRTVLHIIRTLDTLEDVRDAGYLRGKVLRFLGKYLQGTSGQGDLAPPQQLAPLQEQLESYMRKNLKRILEVDGNNWYVDAKEKGMSRRNISTIAQESLVAVRAAIKKLCGDSAYTAYLDRGGEPDPLDVGLIICSGGDPSFKEEYNLPPGASKIDGLNPTLCIESIPEKLDCSRNTSNWTYRSINFAEMWLHYRDVALQCHLIDTLTLYTGAGMNKACSPYRPLL